MKLKEEKFEDKRFKPQIKEYKLKKEDNELTQIFDESQTKRDKKHFYDYYGTNRGKKHLKAVSDKTGIPVEDLLYKVQKDTQNKRNCFYYAHPEIGKDFEKWCKNFTNEREEEKIQERLKEKLGGFDKSYRVTNVGTIDVLTNTLLIEVKFFKEWKEGIGQLILYGLEYPNHQKILHLYGQFRKKTRIDGSTKVLTPELIKNECELLKEKSKFLDIKVIREGEPYTDILNKKLE